jgi:hypothetical protein
MISRRLSRRGVRLLALVGVLMVAAAGVAWATIPDAGGVYTACKLNATGTIRLIDPSLPTSSLLQHCTSIETAISWNQKGQKGDAGLAGANGTNGLNGNDGAKGADGSSPTVAQLAAGDTHCATGGAAITDATGATAYVCNGQTGANGADGANGTPFSGTFTSPNGKYSIAVTDTGVTLDGPGITEVAIAGDDVVVNSLGTFTLKADSDASIRSGTGLTVRSGTTLDLRGGASANLEGAASLTLSGPTLKLNGATSCHPAAAVGDSVLGTATVLGNPFLSLIVTGSPTVCIG